MATAQPEGPVVPTKVCPNCGTQSQTASDKCPNCGKNYRQKKGGCLKWIGISLLVLLLTIVGCVAIVGGGGGDEAANEIAQIEEAVQPEDEASDETASQRNARRAAENYLDTAPFSRKGLIRQLEFEGYSTADATYAVDAVSPNWNEQAAKAAKNYLDTQPFSRSGLIQQLKFEGFTHQQAVYGVNQAGL